MSALGVSCFNPPNLWLHPFLISFTFVVQPAVKTRLFSTPLASEKIILGVHEAVLALNPAIPPRSQ
ncbi:hypothetical protein BDR04DRAFT_1162266 [Suillus decipiens]|nr:hypothetical protein BDR04DRAFT_1162266 [Suillus decipiens]